jgi:hypothetical protein
LNGKPNVPENSSVTIRIGVNIDRIDRSGKCYLFGVKAHTSIAVFITAAHSGPFSKTDKITAGYFHLLVCDPSNSIITPTKIVEKCKELRTNVADFLT